MAKKIIKAQMKQRRDTFANWAAENPVLLDGELGIVSDDPNLYKVGDGSTAWNALPFRGFDGTLAQELGTSPNAVISQKVVSEKLSELSERINNLPQGDEFDKQGNYPLLHVGTADDLAGRGESVPAEFGFRASGGKSIKDGRAYIKRIKGNSVVWNQSCKPFSAAIRKPNNGEESEHGASLTNWEEYKPYVLPASLLSKIGHKCVLTFSYTNTSPSPKFAVEIAEAPEMRHYYTSDKESVAIIFDIVNSAKTDNINVFSITDQTGDVAFSNLHLYDLTQMFQAGNEPTTIEEFNARVATLGVDLNAYNEGQVIHCNTESIKSVGDNAWDEEWEDSKEITANGSIFPSTDGWITTNYTRVIPNAQYYIYCDINGFARARFYDANKLIIGIVDANKQDVSTNKEFTVPANAHYVKFAPRYSQIPAGTPLMLTLVHSGWKVDTNAGYQPYWQDTLPLPIIRKYFPDGMKKAGSAHDEIRYNKASGKWEAVQRIGEVDMGTLNWSLHSSYGYYATMPSSMVVGNLNYLTERSYTKYANPDRLTWEGHDKAITNGLATIGTSWARYLVIKDSSYTDATSFKTAMSGVMLYYELAEPIVTELDEADQNFRDYYNVADFGTEQSQSSVPSAPFSADIIYQFNAVDMIREHELEITELQKVIATMQAQLTSLTNGVA